MNNDLLNLKEAAEWLKKSESTIYRLISEGKLQCYGVHYKRKLFSIEKHLIPYLESIETKLIMPETKKPNRKSSGRTYVYKTSLFDDL